MNQTPSSWIGHTLSGRYKIESLLGYGGMSSVYKATDPNLQRAVAVKIIHPHLSQEPEFVKRFEQEAAAVAKLRHPNIVQVYDFDHEGNVYYIVLEYVAGEDLAKRLSALKYANLRLPFDDTIRIMSILCEAVAEAHEQNIIHRDLKPSNVIINLLGQPILTDFGIAKIVGNETLTNVGVSIGTATYMSPEQANALPVDHRTDIYALGIMLYEMIAGCPPFEGESISSVIIKHLNEPVPDIRLFNHNIPYGIMNVLQKALAKAPDERFSSARDMAAALKMMSMKTMVIPERSFGDSLSNLDTGPQKPSPPFALDKTRVLMIALACSLILLLFLLVWQGVGDTEQVATEPVATEPVATEQAATEPSEAQQVGTLRFTDDEVVRAGNCALQMNRVSLPPAESHYQLWLVNDNKQKLLDLGPLEVENGRIEFTRSTNENLLANYSRVLISIEPNDDPDEGISEQIAFSGALSDSFLTHGRPLLVADESNGPGFVLGAEEQARVALEHSGFLRDSLAAGDLLEAQRHAEHVVNILDGENGSHFGDLNNDGQAQNPGDGFGVGLYLDNAKEGLQLMVDSNASEDRQIYASESTQGLDNSQRWLESSIKQAQKVLAADSVAEAQPLADELEQQINSLLNGSDEDDNGMIEGTILSAYESTLLLGEISIFTHQEDASAVPEGTVMTPAPPATSEPIETTPTAETVSSTPTPEGPVPSSQGMVKVDGGIYTVGEDKQVELNDFWIDQQEASNAEYAQFIAETGQEAPAYWAEKNIPNEMGEHPVESITWQAADAYCTWANKRLPSEVEWEIAARGPHGWLYPWGNNKETVNLPSSDTYPVGTILENRSFFGAFDMAGNVWEWVDEPYLAVKEEERVLRGGANNFQNDMTFRIVGDPNNSTMFINAGIRCASSQVVEEATPNVLLRDDFSDINSGWWQARAPVDNYFYGYHPTDFYHMQISAPETCLSIDHAIPNNNIMTEVEVFINTTDTEEGTFRYGVTMRSTERDFYSFVISPRRKSWQVLKSTTEGFLLMDEGKSDSIRGDTKETRDRLFVIADDSRFTFFVNGELVSRLEDNEYDSGNIGFMVENFDESYTHIHFDSITVWKLPANAKKSETPISTPYTMNSPLCQGAVSASDTLTAFISHTVLQDETLSGIAQQYSVTVAEILAANGKNINNPDAIKTGQTVIVPQVGN